MLKNYTVIKYINTMLEIMNADSVWASVVDEATKAASNEPAMAELLDEIFLSRSNLFDCVCYRISAKLESRTRRDIGIINTFTEAFATDKSIRENVVKDIVAIRHRDPACQFFMNPILYFKGFHAITTHRVAHWLWNNGKVHTAYYLQSLMSEVFAVDIHPAAKFGGGILLDHATSFVAGETTVVEDNVSILHEVTLGGTGNEIGDRHPKIKSGVLIGAGAKLIGNITIGNCAKIGAGSVVLNDVPPHTTVAGVPAKPIASAYQEEPASCMDQNF